MKKKLVICLWLIAGLLFVTSWSAGGADLVGKWELVRLEYADGKPKEAPSKSKMGGAEFFQDKKVVFSDGLNGEWTMSGDGHIKITLMEFLEMSGSMQGDLLKLETEVDPNEILVLKKKK